MISPKFRVPFLLLLPCLLALGIFILIPLAGSLAMAFARVRGNSGFHYVGLANFRFLLTDRMFWWSLLNTTLFAAGFLLVQTPLALGLAAGLHSRHARLRSVVRLALFTPYFVGPVYASVLFGAMLDTRYGLINHLLGVSINWLGNPRLALVSMLLVGLWMSVGFASLYLAAAMQGINSELYDAANVDGAGSWSRFWHITLPSIQPMLLLLALVGTIQAYQLFELPYVLFGGPGPSSAGMTVVMYLYGVGFEAGDFGYASAVGWSLVLFLLLLTLGSALVYRQLKHRMTPRR